MSFEKTPPGLSSWRHYLKRSPGLSSWRHYWTQFMKTLPGLSSWRHYLDSVHEDTTWTQFMKTLPGLSLPQKLSSWRHYLKRPLDLFMKTLPYKDTTWKGHCTQFIKTLVTLPEEATWTQIMKTLPEDTSWPQFNLPPAQGSMLWIHILWSNLLYSAPSPTISSLAQEVVYRCWEKFTIGNFMAVSHTCT